MSSRSSDPERAVAIIGAACRLPGGGDTPDRLWAMLAEGRRLAAARTPRHLPSATAGAPQEAVPAIRLDRVDLFDAVFFGISPREAVRMDPQHRIFLETAVEALDAAGQPRAALAGRPVGVFLGIASSDYAWLPEAMACPPDVHSAVGGGPVFAANRLSHVLDLRGPSLAVDTTCSSSLVAVHLACRSVREGESSLAIVGGVNLILSEDVAACAAQSVPLATDGLCKAFAADADGTVRGEGCVVLVLKPLAQALRDGDPVLAVILGSAVNHDGHASALTAPNPAAQTAVIRDACRDAGVAPARIAFLEAHGTGTTLGDAIEIEAAAEALDAAGERRTPCDLAAIKAQIGHLEAAAGAAGLLRAALTLSRGRVTPHPLRGRPHPLLADHGRILRLATGERVLSPGDLAGVSAFSLGGTNAHVVLGRPPPRPARAPSSAIAGTRIVPVSARSPAALSAKIEHLRDALEAGPLAVAELADIAHTSCARASQHPLRRAMVADDCEELRRQLRSAAARPNLPRAVRLRADRLAFVFAGHGSQWAGMARGLCDREPVFAAAVARLDRLFARHLDWSVAAFLREEADASRMARADLGQPALLTVQLALADLFRARGVVPQGVLGYSAGELAAMTLAGMIDEAEAVRFAALRAMALGDAGAGGMLAVRAAERSLPGLLVGAGGDLAVAAICGPEGAIVAGSRPDIERFARHLDEREVLSLDSGVPYAFHHPAMTEVARAMADRLEAAEFQWREGDLPVYSSVVGRRLDLGDINRAFWIDGACATLRFDRAAEAALDDGFEFFLEVGPAAALTADLRDTIRARGSGAVAVASLRRGIGAERALAVAGAELYEAGCLDDLRPFNPPGGMAVPLPSYPWDQQSFWWPPLPEPVDTVAVASAPVADPKVYRLVWAPEPAAPIPPPSTEPSPWPLTAIEGRCADQIAAAGLQSYAAREAEIDRVCLGYAGRALAELGGRLAPGATLDPAVIADRHGFDRGARRLLDHLCRMLAQDGLLMPAEDGWRATGLASPEPEEDLQQLIEALPEARHELGLLARCGPRLAGVLRGEVDPLALIFPNAEIGETEAIFSRSSIAAVVNAHVADVVNAVLRDAAPDRPLKVLEIGAGTGGTTEALRARLDRPSVSYCCTDVSRTLLRHAAQRFADWERFETRRLDIARDPGEQGFLEAGFDLVVAANVLHATPDIAAALRHARHLLAPEGTLILLEVTTPQRLIDLTFGLTRDWWAFEDTALRPDHPLLPRAQWLHVLAEAGFGEIAATPIDPALAAALGASVLIARGGAVRPAALPAARPWLVLAAPDEVADAVAMRLAETGAAAEVHGQVGEADLARLLDRPWAGLIDLRAFGLRCDPRFGSEAAMHALETAVSDLLFLTRCLARRAGPPLRLIVSTVEAVAVDGGDVPPDPAQAAVRAAVETLAAEHPDWPVVALDCAPAAPAAVAEAVAGEIRRAAGSAFPAWRRGRRWAAALARVERPARASAPAIDADKLHVITGGLGALGLEVADWLAARGAHHLLLAQRGPGNAQARERVAALRGRGVAVELAAVDLADSRAAADFAARIASGQPPVGGIVHAAGRFDDALLLAQDWTRFARVIAPKAVGAWELARAFAARGLDYVVLCSSVANLLNPAGLSNYVAGNAFLAALAERMRREGLPATCIAWGGWAGLGMAAGRDDRWLDGWRSRGITGLTGPDTLEALDRAAAGVLPSFVAVMDVDWDRCVDHLPPAHRPLASGLRATHAPGRPRTTAERTEAARVVVPDVFAAPPHERRERIQAELRRRCLKMLELPERFDLDPAMPLADLGLDSLLALELRSDLCAAFALDLPATLLFDHPSLAALTAHIVERAAAEAPGVQATATSATAAMMASTSLSSVR